VRDQDYRTSRQRELDELRERQGDDLRFLELDVSYLAIQAPAPPVAHRDREILELELRRIAEQFRTAEVAAAIDAAAPLVAGRLAQSFLANTRYTRDPDRGSPKGRAEERLTVGYPDQLERSVRTDVETFAFLVTLADQCRGGAQRRVRSSNAVAPPAG
jgi:hypothetical protein